LWSSSFHESVSDEEAQELPETNPGVVLFSIELWHLQETTINYTDITWN
jgi:hypothetical protein